MSDETFTPESVDEQVDQHLSPFQEDQVVHPSAKVVQHLHSLYEEDLLATAHVWERLVQQVSELDLAERQTEHFPALFQERTLPLPIVPRSANPSRRQKRQSSHAGQIPFGRRVSLFAAVLVMIVLVGSLVVVLREIHSKLPVGISSNTPGQTVYSMIRGSEDGVFNDLAWSPDSRRVAALRIDGVRIWDATTGGNLVNVPLPAHMLRSLIMAWSPNGKWIAISGYGTEIAIADAQTGALVHQYSAEAVAESLPAASGSSHLSASLPASGGTGGNVSGLAWSPDSQWLAVTVSGYSTSRNFNILDVQTGALVHHFADDQGSHINGINVASWSPDGKYLAASVNIAYALPMVWVWDTSTYQVVLKQSGGGGAGGAFEHSDQIVWQPHSDNLTFATWERNPTIALWDVAKKKLLNQYTVASFGQFAWSPDGTYLASVSYPNQSESNHRIVIIDVQSGRQVYVYTQHNSPLVAVAWSPDGKYIVSADVTVVKVWVAP